jgi:hypothetical protein
MPSVVAMTKRDGVKRSKTAVEETTIAAGTTIGGMVGGMIVRVVAAGKTRSGCGGSAHTARSGVGGIATTGVATISTDAPIRVATELLGAGTAIVMDVATTSTTGAIRAEYSGVTTTGRSGIAGYGPLASISDLRSSSNSVVRLGSELRVGPTPN